MFADIHSVRNFRVTLKIEEATASKTKCFLDLKKIKIVIGHRTNTSVIKTITDELLKNVISAQKYLLYF